MAHSTGNLCRRRGTRQLSSAGPIEVRTIKGNQRGIFATRSIAAGEVILVENPFFVFDTPADDFGTAKMMKGMAVILSDTSRIVGAALRLAAEDASVASTFPALHPVDVVDDAGLCLTEGAVLVALRKRNHGINCAKMVQKLRQNGFGNMAAFGCFDGSRCSTTPAIPTSSRMNWEDT